MLMTYIPLFKQKMMIFGLMSKNYIELMQHYFNGNQLVINVDKTQVMIIQNT